MRTLLILLFFLLVNCSFDSKTGIWNNSGITKPNKD